jgi:hypothetical protein
MANKFFAGYTVPSNSLGNNGDFYLQLGTSLLFTMADLVWGNSISFLTTGPQGPEGPAGPPGPISTIGSSRVLPMFVAPMPIVELVIGNTKKTSH